MKERGMIFNAEMVRAILDGRKTQTRRIIKQRHLFKPVRGFGFEPDSLNYPVHMPAGAEGEEAIAWAKENCPHGKPGDRIWVRETFSCIGNEDGHPVDAHGNLCSREDAQRIYRASAIQKPKNYGLWASPDGFDFEGAWTPAIHMPRWASRILLEITNVRVERLRSMSQADARAEGVIAASGPMEAGLAFRELWDSIYGIESWQANPWVWVIEFKRVDAHAAQQEEDFSTPPSEMFECDVCGCITDAPEGMHYCYEGNSDD